jgi:hypothetical protein
MKKWFFWVIAWVRASPPRGSKQAELNSNVPNFPTVEFSSAPGSAVVHTAASRTGTSKTNSNDLFFRKVDRKTTI